MALYEQPTSMFLYQPPAVEGAAAFEDAAAPPRDLGVYRETAVSAAVDTDTQPTLYRRAQYVHEPFVDEPNYYFTDAEPEPEHPVAKPAPKNEGRFLPMRPSHSS